MLAVWLWLFLGLRPGVCLNSNWGNFFPPFSNTNYFSIAALVTSENSSRPHSLLSRPQIEHVSIKPLLIVFAQLQSQTRLFSSFSVLVNLEECDIIHTATIRSIPGSHRAARAVRPFVSRGHSLHYNPKDKAPSGGTKGHGGGGIVPHSMHTFLLSETHRKQSLVRWTEF